LTRILQFEISIVKYDETVVSHLVFRSMLFDLLLLKYTTR
jgi:hypothetical protein